MSIAVPQELQQFIRQEIASGKFRSEDDVVSAALRLLQEHERKRDALVQDLQIGIDELDAGKAITIADEQAHEEFFHDIEKRGLERLAAKRGTP